MRAPSGSTISAAAVVLAVCALAGPATAAVAAIPDTLLPGGVLASGGMLANADGDTFLYMNPNGELQVCLGTPEGGCVKRLWGTLTMGNPGAFLTLSQYGVLNLDAAGSAPNTTKRLWQSHTMEAAGCKGMEDVCPSFLFAQRNGDVVLKNGTAAKPGATLWQSNTLRPPKNAKNVLMIVVDDLRTQMNYAYNQTQMHTPNLDKLGRSSLVFTHSYVNFAVCNPSRNSFMTGRKPDSTMTWNFRNSFRGAGNGPGNAWQTIPQYFKNAGWTALGGGKLFHPCCGLELQDYSRSWTHRLNDHFWFFNRGMCNDTHGENPYCEHDCPGDYSSCPVEGMPDDFFYDNRLAKHTIASLQAVKHDPEQRPWFIAAGFRRPHNNWLYDKKYQDLYPARDDMDVAKYPHAPKNVPPVAFNPGGFKFADCNGTGCQSSLETPMAKTYQQEARRAYYGAVSWVDAQIGMVLDELDTLGLADNTIVALFGDHGWQLGELGEWHKHTNFELATRVPLIVRVPGSPSQGKHTGAFVELVDVYPTLAELAGVPGTPPGVDGSSFAQVLDNPAVSPKNASFSQYARCPQDPAHPDLKHSCDEVRRGDITIMGYTMRTEDWRYTAWFQFNGTSLSAIWEAPTWGVELYDHRGDTGTNLDMPFETVNVANQTEFHAIQAELHMQLVQHFYRSPEQIETRNAKTPNFPCGVGN